MTRDNLLTRMVAEGYSLQRLSEEMNIPKEELTKVLNGEMSTEKLGDSIKLIRHLEALFEIVLDMSIKDIREAWNNEDEVGVISQSSGFKYTV